MGESNLHPIDKVWIKLRQGKKSFLFNKFLSTFFAFGMAGFTLAFKRDLTVYNDTYKNTYENTSTYVGIYWLLMIYYSFAGLDELLELYAVVFNRAKGALGLLFEMNYFFGLGVVIYLVTFLSDEERSAVPEEHINLLKFLKYQVVFFYIAIALSVLMVIGLWIVNGHAHRINIETAESLATQEQ